MNITDHLTTGEIACKCGCGFGTGIGDFALETAKAFEEICKRTGLACSANVPIIITSGCRCAEHNRDVEGSPKSRHIHGDALDLVCPDCIPYRRFYEICDTVIGEEGGVGWYWPKKNIVHIDTRGRKVRWKQT